MLLLATGVGMARLSWLKWLDPIVDFGRELYVPWRIAEGEVLYRDINHFYGPLSDYVIAGLFRVFGVGLETLALCNLLLLVLFTSGLYFYLKQHFGYLAATVCGLAFLTIFAFSQHVDVGNYNYVCPYSHEMLHGLYLAAVLLLVLMKIERTGKWYWSLAAGVLSGLIFLTKVEVAVAAVAALALFFFYFLREQGAARAGHVLAAFICGWSLPLLGFWACFSLKMPWLSALQTVFMSFYSPLVLTGLTHNLFYFLMSGMDDPLSQLNRMVIVLVAELLYVGSLALGLSCVKRIRNEWLRFCAYGGVVIFLIGFALCYKTKIPWFELERPYPLYLLALAGFYGYKRFRNKSAVSLTLLAAAVFSLALLAKIILAVNVFSYGFALTMPATLLLVAVALQRDTVLRRFAALSFFVVMAMHVENSRLFYQQKTFPVGTGADRFYTYRPELDRTGLVLQETLQKMNAVIPATATVAVFPEGVMLNYLARRRNPAYFFEAIPSFIAGVGEQRMLGYLQVAPPDFVLITGRETEEHGASYFGKDYAFALWSWITARYEKLETIGPEPFTDRGFGITIMKPRHI